MKTEHDLPQEVIEAHEQYADDNTEGVRLLIRLRLPWLLAGLVGASLASLLVSRFEATLARDIHLAFFLPAIVYMSDAVGTQTENIYVRNVAREKINYSLYVVKEFLLGLSIGALFGVIIWGVILLWLHDTHIAMTVGLAMFINITIAPLLALMLPSLLEREHTDPALGAGPITTIIQQILSLFIYFAVASFILLR
jgi:magnesium transporter